MTKEILVYNAGECLGTLEFEFDETEGSLIQILTTEDNIHVIYLADMDYGIEINCELATKIIKNVELMEEDEYMDFALSYKIIATDFDGTLCEDAWPKIGAPNIELIEYLKDQKKQGVRLILWTCRAGDKLQMAVNWCKHKGLYFNAVNENLPDIIEVFGSDTRKIFAHEYIDDKLSAQFKLPFVCTKTGITDDMIKELEIVFGFPFHDWQKSYLKGDDNSVPFNVRGCGKTFIRCTRILLENREPFKPSREALEKMVDEDNPCYFKWFRDNLWELDRILRKSGFKTNLLYN